MILTFEEHTPVVPASAFVAHDANVIGQVQLGAATSVWYGTTLRGDVGRITVGDRTNLQDLSVVHVTGGVHDTEIGSDVTVGHRAIVHGCRVAHHVLIGMGAIVMDGAEIQPYCLVGAGALVTPGTKIPEGMLVVGAPAKPVRALRDRERQQIEASAQHYAELGARHARSAHPA